MSHPDDQSPVNSLPPVVTALFLLLVGVEAALWLGSKGIVGGPTAVGWRLDAIQRYAFAPDIFDWMIANGVFPPEHMLRRPGHAQYRVTWTGREKLDTGRPKIESRYQHWKCQVSPDMAATGPVG